MKKPLFKLKEFEALSIDALTDAEKRVVFLDADNTLFLPKVPLAQQKVQKVKRKLQALQKAGITIVVISNNFSTDRSIFFADLAIPTIFFAKKPLPLAYRKARKRVEQIVGRVEKDAIVHIGDQLLTDGFGSLIYGVDYILVDPIDTNADLIFAKPSRLLEKMLRI